MCVFWDKHNVLQLARVGHFLWRFLCKHCSCQMYKSNWGLKLIPWWSYHTHGINFLLWSSTFGVDRGEFSLSIHCFCVEHCHKRPIFFFLSSVMIFFWNRLFLCFERRLIAIKYVIFFIRLTKSIKKPNAQFTHFSYLFHVAADCGFGCDEVRWYFSCNFGRLAFPQFSKSILIQIWWASGFIFRWRITRTKLWNQVWNLVVIKDTLAINTKKFLDCFCSVFVILKLPRYYMSNMHIFHFKRPAIINKILMRTFSQRK